MLFIMLSIDLVFNKLMNELVTMKFRLFNWFNSLLIDVSFDEVIEKQKATLAAWEEQKEQPHEQTMGGL